MKYKTVNEAAKYLALHSEEDFHGGASWQKEELCSILKDAIRLLKDTAEYEVVERYRQEVSKLEQFIKK